MTGPTDRSPAEAACIHLLRLIQIDGRLAYLIGPGSQSYALLTEAGAQIFGEDIADFRRSLAALIRPVRIVEREA